MILDWRTRRGKEEPERRPERYGIASSPRPAGFLVWFHAASVGETNAILPLMAALAEERPSLSFLLTTGTVTSAKLAGERLMPRAVHQYAPLDAPEYVRSFLDHWRPDLAVFTESEIWPNLILESSARHIPLALVNARMTKRSFRRWRSNPSVARPLFSRFALVLAQNENLAHRFKTLGAVCHPDRQPQGRRAAPLVNQVELERLRDVCRPLVADAASTHDGEDQIIADAHSEPCAAACPICAPSSRRAIPSAAAPSRRC
jgi:3-deoxy-D-manno-octulosonic-acid transferase